MLTIDVDRQDLLDGLAAPSYSAPDAGLLAEDVRLLCTPARTEALLTLIRSGSHQGLLPDDEPT